MASTSTPTSARRRSRSSARRTDMKRIVVAVALLAACRGDKVHRKDAGLTGSASVVSVVPKLPITEDGVAELRRIDLELSRATRLADAVQLRLERAAIRGLVED